MKKQEPKNLVALRSFLISLSTPMLVLGLVVSLNILYIKPGILSIVMVSLYLVLLLLKKFLLAPTKKPIIKIVDHETGKPIVDLSINVFSAKYRKLVATKTSNEQGRFNLLLPDGSYFFDVASPIYGLDKDVKNKNGYDGETVKISRDKKFSGLNIYLKKKELA